MFLEPHPAGVGARALRLALYRVDGEVALINLGLTHPTRDAAHVARLVDLELGRPGGRIEAGFGFEALALMVARHAPIEPEQIALAPEARGGRNERCAALVDGLRQRLGPRSVRRFRPVESHVPERSERLDPTDQAPGWPRPDPVLRRPPLLLSPAEPVEVVAAAPDGPPVRLRWRGTTHRIVATEGPERIAPEWWREPGASPTRDYYLVEDEMHRRLWLFRAQGTGEASGAARWFVHGLFA